MRRLLQKVTVQQDQLDGGFIAECSRPWAVSQGDTRSEALANLRDAVDAVDAVLAAQAPPSDHPLSGVWALCRRLDDAANAATRPRPQETR